MKFLKDFPLRVILTIVVQFILGMYVTIYVQLPEDGDVAADWEFAHTSLPLMAHVALGVLILLASLAYLIVVAAKKQKQLLACAIWGFVSVLAAVAGGERFMASQNDAFSMLMALGFISAIVAYATAWRQQVDAQTNETA